MNVNYVNNVNTFNNLNNLNNINNLNNLNNINNINNSNNVNNINNVNNVKNILSKINNMKLNIEQYIEIYKIIKLDTNIKIMKNNNGVFIDLLNLDNNILKKLETLIHYISTNELSQNTF